MCLYGPFGPRLRAPIRKSSSRDPLRKRQRIGSIAPVKLGLKNAGENAMADRRKRLPDHRRRRIEDPDNYQITGWLLVLGIASFCVAIVLKWFWV
jgi:hypothetical protein